MPIEALLDPLLDAKYLTSIQNQTQIQNYLFQISREGVERQIKYILQY